MNAPEVWWSPSLAEALSQGGLIERTGPDLWHQENGLWHRLDELPADAVRLVPATLNSELQVGAVPDTGQAHETGADWAARPRRFSPADTLSVAERLGAAEPSQDTVQAPDVTALAYARSEVDKWLADNDPYCILPTRTEHIPALLARLDELEETQ